MRCRSRANVDRIKRGWQRRPQKRDPAGACYRLGRAALAGLEAQTVLGFEPRSTLSRGLRYPITLRGRAINSNVVIRPLKSS